MSERYRPKRLVRDRIQHPERYQPRSEPRVEPRPQTVWRNGKSTILQPLLCRLHNEPWQTCTKCGPVKR